MKSRADVLLVAVPLTLWAIHICCLVPYLGTLSGDEQFITATWFFLASGLLMLVCEIGCIVQYVMTRRSYLILGMILNMSWLYYLKVIYFGPTIGNF
jgi:hypothetical protein